MLPHHRARALALPGVLAVAVAGLTLVPQIHTNHALVRAFLGASAVLAAGVLILARAGPRELIIEIVPRRAHWVQALAQATILVYWGWHVRIVYDFAPFILAQLLVAYGSDALLSFARRGRYRLGFGPVPVVLSINLFLWFRPDWFHWQFAMIVLGYLAKEFIHWNREGRSTHVFNPSSFPLAVFSLVLILTGTTGRTFGPEIAATQAVPPHIYAVIFLAALPGQFLFGVASMTLTAVASAYGAGLLYFVATGTYFFRDSYIPAAVFLGMHLLFTDPSTSPRSGMGRVLFGVMYGLGTTALAVLLLAVGAPGFYDKLLIVPLLNLCVPAIDRLAPSLLSGSPDRFLGAQATPGGRLAVVSVWAALFVGMSASAAIGDRHPGQWLPFWEAACEGGSERACGQVVRLETGYCNMGSAWACNELGVRLARRDADHAAALASLERACSGGLLDGCENARRLVRGDGDLTRGPPRLVDLPVVLRGNKGPLRDESRGALIALAAEQGWRLAGETALGAWPNEGGPKGCGASGRTYIRGNASVPHQDRHVRRSGAAHHPAQPLEPRGCRRIPPAHGARLR